MHNSSDSTDGPDSALRKRVLSLRLSQDKVSRGGGSKLAWTVAALLAVVVVVLIYLLLQRGPAEPQTAASPDEGTGKASATPTASSGNIALDSKGYIMPVQRILVSPKVSGMITKLFILEGRRVKKGDVLAQVEDIDYRADLEHVESTLEAARQRLGEIETSRPQEIGQATAELARSKAEFAQLKADFERSRELYFKQKALSQLEYELAESKFRAEEQHVRSLEFALGLMDSSRGKRLAAAQAEVKVAQADLAKAQWRLDNCTIRAPINGTILKKNAEEGNLVNPIAMNGSFSLCDLADLSDLEVELTIEERDISKVSTGQKCKVRTEAYPNRIYEGVVSRLMPVADRSKAAIPVRVKVTVPQDEEGVYLKPDMIAMVAFLNEVKDAPKPPSLPVASENAGRNKQGAVPTTQLQKDK